ncbi:Speckle-type POZ protein like [Argiope bruennichi]|uniref:Speckle-type POZ protein like n=1 Tax=Argiope bruennichi TaxID=94029 RepID=A0A8T0EI30_ARGBR|nr:Speckle-type POZ protein like [Argiope bruennichi]
MSNILSSEREGFLFTWKVKNINVSYGEEKIVSPKFTAYNLFHSSWIMSLSPSSAKDSFNLNLELTDATVGLMRLVNLSITITVITSYGEEFMLEEKKIFDFDKGILTHVTSTQNFMSREETLIFNCHMRSNDDPKCPSLIRCMAHTLIGSEKRCCIWKVRNFINLLPDSQKKYTLFSTASQYPEVELQGTLSNKSKFHIEVHVSSEKKVFIVGKISVLTPKNDLKWSKVKAFFLENGSTTKVIFKFPLVIFRKCPLSYLCNGDLNLLCEFSFSTGAIHSDIEESNYLAEKYHDLKKKENSSITELVRISTVDAEDTSCSNETEETPQTLKEDLRNFYLQKNHCDVIFQIGTEMLQAHKSILCSRSPVFCAMFDSDMKETVNKKVDIIDMDIDTFDLFLLFLYSETLEDLTWDSATKLLYAANKYQVESLKIECTSFLMSNISVDNVCEALKLSDLYQDEKLKSACQNLIFKHEAEIFSSKEWEILTVENPLLSAKTLQNHFGMKK